MPKGFRRLLRKLGGSAPAQPEVVPISGDPSSNSRPTSVAATIQSFHTDVFSSKKSTSSFKSDPATIQPAPALAEDSVSAPSPPSTLVTDVSAPKFQAADPDRPPPTKSTWSVAWNGLSTSLRVLRDSSDAFPPLKSAVGGLLAILNVVQAAATNREDYETLSLELRTMAETLTQYTNGLASIGQTSNIARILLSIDAEVNHISAQQGHGGTRRFLEAPQDSEDVMKRYQRIEALFRQLHTDISLQTWDDARKLREDALLQKLSPVHDAQFNSSFSTTIKRRGCTAKTREKVQEDLQEWATAAKSGEIYWMNGMAGTGKSTIAYSFCESLEHKQLLGGNFFCSRLSASCNKANSIVPTLAYQLAHYSLAFRSALCTILDEHPDAGKRDIRWQFQKLVQQPLQGVKAAIEEDVVVVIDALDECMDISAVGLFLGTALRLSGELPIKFFITSRPEPAIQARTLKHRNMVRLHLHDIEETIVTGDIREYLQEALASMDPGPSPFQLRQLAHRSGKLFIYAATAVRYILPETGSVDSTKRLETVLKPVPTGSTKQYAELNTLYSTILLAAIKNDALEVEEQDDMHRVLKTVICAKEPMTIVVIATLLTLSQRQVRFSLDPLQSVLHLQEEDGLVSALHASFPDYMFDESRSNQFHCDRRLYDESLANACFDVMERELRFNICNLESSYLFDDEVQDLAKRIEKAISPALSYACRQWGGHLQIGVNTTAAHSRLVDFLTKRLLFWMEVLNLLKRLVIGSELLQRAATWLKDSQKDTRELLDDANVFVNRYHNGACSRSTPHIYVSRLPFCRKASPLHKNYSSQTRGLIDVRGAAVEERSDQPPVIWLTQSAIECIAVSPNGTRIVSGSRDKTIRVWDARTGETIAEPLAGHQEQVSSVAFSPDGNWFVTGSADKTILVWDAENGDSMAGPFVGHEGRVKSVAVSPDGARIFSGSDDGTIRVWDARTGAPGLLNRHEQSVNSVACSFDGTRIVSGSNDKTIRVWDARTGECLAGPFTGHVDEVNSVAFSPDGTRIVSASGDTTVRVWDARTGASAVEPLAEHGLSVASATFSSDSTRIVSGSHDGTIRIWDAKTGKAIAGPFTGHDASVNSVAFAPNSSQIVSGSDDHSIRIWEAIPEESNAGLLAGHQDWVSSVAFSPDGGQIISGSGDRTLRVWDAHTGEPVAGPFCGHEMMVHSLAVSPDGGRIVSSSFKSIRVWDIGSGECVVGPLVGHTKFVCSVAFSPDGGKIVSGSRDKTIRMWDAQTGDSDSISGLFAGHKASVNSVAFSPDGRYIVSGSGDKMIRVWETRTGEAVAGPFTGHKDTVYSVAFSPEGTRVVSGSYDRTIRIWDAQSGETVAGPFIGHGDAVRSVAFSHDGTRIVSGSEDKTIRIWNALTGESIVGPFTGHGDPVYSAVFSPDGTRIVSGSSDRSIRIWDLSHSSLSEHPIVHPGRDTSSIDTFGFTRDGWTFCNGLPFIWVHPDSLSHFPYPYNPFVIGSRGSASINYRDIAIGKTWFNCYGTGT